MKVLLVQAYLGDNVSPVFPLGLACIAASLPDHETKIFDTNTAVNPFKILRDLVIDFTPDIVGISLRNIDSTNKRTIVFYYEWLKDLITVIQEGCSAKIALGGSGFSMFAREIMEREPAVDFGVYLEGERSFIDLLNNLDTPQKVSSIFYRYENKIHFTGNSHPVDLNTTSVPSWDALSFKPYLTESDAIGIETKRGCALGCIYCVYGFLNGHKYRLKQPERVVDEIKLLVNKYDVTHFTFVDSIFNVPLDHARNICHEIIARKITVTWSAWFNERFIDQDFLSLLVQAGCNHIIFSPDGFTDPVLKKLGKNISRLNILNSLRLLKNTKDIEVSYNFFRNPPGQSLTNFLGMLFFFLQAKLLMRKRVHFEFSVLRIEPHTELYRIALDEGVITAEQSLLEPTYYSNRRSKYLEILFNFILTLVGK